MAAVRHGLRLDPRDVAITVRWLDLDRVRVEITWKGCSVTALPSAEQCDLGSAADVLDACADEWGFETGSADPMHWIVLDTR